MPKGRKRIMGLPVGKPKPGFPLARAAKVGAMGVSLAAAIPAVHKAIPAAQKGADVVGKGQPDPAVGRGRSRGERGRAR